MLKTSCGLIAALVVGIMASSAQASTFSLVGEGNLYKWDTTGTASVPSSAKLGFGGGALVDFSLSPRVGLEVGALYVMHKQTWSSNPVKTTSLEVPVLLRYWFTPMFTIGVGGYFSSAMGQVDANGTNEDYSKAGISKSDMGIAGDVGISLPMGPSSRFIMDARYLLGLKDLDDPTSSGTTTKTKDIEFLVGVAFPFGNSR